VGLAACATWLLVAAIARISSLSALVAFALSPLYALAFADRGIAAAAVAIAALVYLRHAGNIRRLLAGTEPRIGERR
jgi:glycerol-3-phosphate acyltransferase PlsY